MSMAGDVRYTVLYFCIKNDIPQDKAIALLNELVEDMDGDPENYNFGEWVAEEYTRLHKAAQQSVKPTVADIRPYCTNHEIFYEFELGCPACPPRR